MQNNDNKGRPKDILIVSRHIGRSKPGKLPDRCGSITIRKYTVGLLESLTNKSTKIPYREKPIWVGDIDDVIRRALSVTFGIEYLQDRVIDENQPDYHKKETEPKYKQLGDTPYIAELALRDIFSKESPDRLKEIFTEYGLPPEENDTEAPPV